MSLAQSNKEKVTQPANGDKKPTEPFKGSGAVPETHDWRNVKGVDYTGGVRDQGACGSCYTFAFIG
jgi:C1A family cysteine protease